MSSGRPREVFFSRVVRDGQIVVGRHGVTYNYYCCETQIVPMTWIVFGRHRGILYRYSGMAY